MVKLNNLWSLPTIVTVAMLSLISVSCVNDDDNEKIPSVVVNGHEAVDLGLPSGTKWATMNIGAISAYDHGKFFQWGEITHINGDENVAWNSNYKPRNIAYKGTTSSNCGTMDDAVFADGLIAIDATGKWNGSIAGNANYDAAIG